MKNFVVAVLLFALGFGFWTNMNERTSAQATIAALKADKAEERWRAGRAEERAKRAEKRLTIVGGERLEKALSLAPDLEEVCRHVPFGNMPKGCLRRVRGDTANMPYYMAAGMSIEEMDTVIPRVCALITGEKPKECGS